VSAPRPFSPSESPARRSTPREHLRNRSRRLPRRLDERVGAGRLELFPAAIAPQRADCGDPHLPRSDCIELPITDHRDPIAPGLQAFVLQEMGDEFRLVGVSAVVARAVDALEVRGEAEMLENAPRVVFVLRCRDEEARSKRAQGFEGGRDAVVDRVLEHADRDIALTVEGHRRLLVFAARQFGETLAQRRADHPAEFGVVR
jgi:hypothetical protein